MGVSHLECHPERGPAQERIKPASGLMRWLARVEGPLYSKDSSPVSFFYRGPSTPRPPDPQKKRVGSSLRALRSEFVTLLISQKTHAQNKQFKSPKMREKSKKSQPLRMTSPSS